MVDADIMDRGRLRALDMVFEDDLLRVAKWGDSEASDIIVCFSGIGKGLGFGREKPTEEMFKTLIGDRRLVLFVTDLTRSWYNAFSHERVLSCLEPIVGDRPIATIGNSMGGFGAVWMSGYLRAHTTIAFGAQYSVKPSVVPDETHWREYVDAITEWRIDSLEGSFNPRTCYFMFSGSTDAYQSSHFPARSNIRNIVVDGAEHNVPQLLKDRGVLRDCIECCLDHRDPLVWLNENGVPAHAYGENREVRA